MGSRSRAENNTHADTTSNVDNSVNQLYDDHSILDNSWHDSSSTSISAVDNSVTTIHNTDGGAFDVVKDVINRSFDFGEYSVAAVSASANKAITSSTSSSASSSATAKFAIASNKEAFGEALENTESGFNAALKSSENTFTKALEFRAEESKSENEKVLEGFQRTALYMAMIGAAVFVVPKVVKL